MLCCENWFFQKSPCSCIWGTRGVTAHLASGAVATPFTPSVLSPFPQSAHNEAKLLFIGKISLSSLPSTPFSLQSPELCFLLHINSCPYLASAPDCLSLRKRLLLLILISQQSLKLKLTHHSISLAVKKTTSPSSLHFQRTSASPSLSGGAHVAYLFHISEESRFIAAT